MLSGWKDVTGSVQAACVACDYRTKRDIKVVRAGMTCPKCNGKIVRADLKHLIEPKGKKPSKRRKSQRLMRMRKAGLWPNPNYAKYIVSRFWFELRTQFLAQSGYRCECCGDARNLQVHHKHYKTLGNERRGDVEVLCRACHTSRHEADGVTQADPLSEAFRATIA
jgi:5-methylcytosine-specific restriction endonuclease McrA